MSIAPSVLSPQCVTTATVESGETAMYFGSGPVGITRTIRSLLVSMMAIAEGEEALGS